MRSSPRLAPCGGVLTCSSSTGVSALCRILLVQFQVECQHVDRGLPEEAEPASVGVVGDGLSDQVRGGAAGVGDAADLYIGVGDGDVRVETAAAGGDGVGGHCGLGGRAAADGNDLADAVVLGVA